MTLTTVPDLQKSLRRFEAWWEGAIIDRPPVTIGVVPERPPREVPEKSYDTLVDKWLDWEHRIDQFEAHVEVGVYLGDSFPWFRPNLGPELAAAPFGCDLEFGESTSWTRPCAEHLDDVLAAEPDLSNRWWQAMLRGLELSLERGRGRWITAMASLILHADLVAAMRHPENLCLDLALQPERVRAAIEHITDFYPTVFEDPWRRIEAAGQMSTTWIPALHDGPWHFTQCDFSCMISPAMFRDFVLPSIVRECRYLERNVYHLDGPDALRHLDTLLETPEIGPIQWVAGAGQGPATDWIDVYRRIQEGGKPMQILAGSPEAARRIAEHLRPEGVWFVAGGKNTRAEAEAFIEWTRKWAAGKA